MAGEEDWRALGAVPLLAPLPPERLREVWEGSVPRRYREGETLRAAGDRAGHLLVLLRGRVAATGTTAAGRAVWFGEWAGPCALDKVALIDGGGHTATFTARTPCAVRALPRTRFLALVDDAAPVRAHVLGVLAGEARRQQRRATETAALPAEARLAGWLLEAAASASSLRVPLPGTQQSLADRLGTTRVTVNRALSRLRRDGLIRVERTGVEILAPELLHLRAISPPS